MLDVAAGLSGHLPADISPTLLAAHALPPEYAGRREDYVHLVLDRILPPRWNRVTPRPSTSSARTSLSRLRKAAASWRPGPGRLHGRLHADQLADLGGGALAAAVGARSADHLEYLSLRASRHGRGGCVRGPPSGAAYTLGADRRPPVTALRRSGVTMAIATDANPVPHRSPMWRGHEPRVHPLRTHPGGDPAGTDRRRGEGPGAGARPGRSAARDARRLCPVGCSRRGGMCYWVGTSPLRSLVKNGEPIS